MIYRFYSNPIQYKARITVVGEWNKEETTFKFSVARCSEKDQFIRKKGRMIAEGRLKKDKIYLTIKNVVIKPTTELFVEYANKISSLVASRKNIIFE